MSRTIFDTDNPKANVVIVHGMQEHHHRYDDFANFLKNAGYRVTTFDLLGHGLDAEVQGHIEAKKPYLELLNQLTTILQETKMEFPKLPIYLIGHSMGTLICRGVVIRHGDLVDKLALIGAPHPDTKAKLGIALTKTMMFFVGPKQTSKFIDNLVFKEANKKYPELTWLSQDPEVVNKYYADELCGNPFSLNYYYALFSGVSDLTKRKYQTTQYNLPIRFFVGSDDPIVGGKKGLEKSIKAMRMHGFENVKYSIYPNMRHELLNEVQHLRVYHDILKFLDYNN